MGSPQPVPTSCVSVTAKNTAHQLPEPCSPSEFLPDQEMPDSGDHVCAGPWPWAQLSSLPRSESEGHHGSRAGAGWGVVGGGMFVGTVDERLRQTWQKCCLQGAQSQWTSAPGQAPCLAQSHVPWVCCCCCYHPGEGDGKGGLRGPTPAPCPSLALGSCFLSKKPSLPDWTGWRWGCFSQLCLWSLLAFASIQAEP